MKPILGATAATRFILHAGQVTWILVGAVVAYIIFAGVIHAWRGRHCRGS